MHFLWQGALVGLAAWIALSLLERAKASTRYGVALGALLLMAVLPFATAFRLAGEIPRPAPSAVDAAPAAAPLVKAPAAAGASRTSTFFSHWLGLQARNSPHAALAPDRRGRDLRAGSANAERGISRSPQNSE